jgi:hypothetical protein
MWDNQNSKILKSETIGNKQSDYRDDEGTNNFLLPQYNVHKKDYDTCTFKPIYKWNLKMCPL